ncbi:Holliday junction DNA helicase RuvA [Parvibaculum lavamentivorans DS-1]|uniref:Holliday junction branch migration complex subunit RuvA n=1 Tax=Parvibaculum lavamentivorans (strain DS-1 / DSM 13023 / NCIMB 13966) TaxID=402881 RepID=RUVA_PARL1|nr:Holliday junction branch migration protein RuvA [Parvibaculum lavamentivorans]A7HUZ7.1 RecName: Full=Holliday junction branch migration complex subunit RuvA [Parvibaculum lavamentivorans DS-1]ABS63730.1 Holliday junction DNA helicase RuvA [Parvibaculum lavamentivorans DS-1]
MIGKLRGIVDSTGEDWAVIDVGGVGYHVTCSSRTLRNLPPAGGAVTLSIETKVSDEAIRLIGFTTDSEREWFRLLLAVQGVGTRVALGVLGTLAPADLARAIALDDKKAVSAAPGVGPKVAARIVTELKDKVPDSMGLSAALEVGVNGEAVSSVSAPARDAVSALVNLGYPQAQAMGAVAAAAKRLDDAASTEQLIRHGLKELAR